jgi:HK97 family phage major capsid protein
VITATAGQEDAAVQSAITALMGAGYQADGIVMTPAMASALAAIKYSGVPAFPELAWGGNPERVKGLASDITTALAFDSSADDALVGDFTNAFKWGYAKDIPMEVIEYGDPDGAGDLKRYNQVYLRAEAYIGWAILDPNAFGIVK